MAWQRGRTSNPTYSSATWQATRRWWQKRKPTVCRAPRCKHRGTPIDYTRGYFIATRAGRVTVNPLALSVGHIVSVAAARRLGWSEDKTNAVSNSRPEHTDCNSRHGSQLGAAIANRRAGRATPAPLHTTRAW